MINLITKGQIFNESSTYCIILNITKEIWHILIWLTNKIDPNQIDSVISAELGSIKELYNIVKTQMSHGSFNKNSPCMKMVLMHHLPRRLKQVKMAISLPEEAYQRMEAFLFWWDSMKLTSDW